MAITRTPRRLSKEARYQQLVELAMPIVAEQGFAEFSLEQLAERADVTRNNLYRYFPRGRPDIAAAVVREAGSELLAGWVTDPSLALDARLRANTAHIAKHAFGPSAAWRIHRKARAADQPEIAEIVADYLDTVVANIALNNLGTADPPAGRRPRSTPSSPSAKPWSTKLATPTSPKTRSNGSSSTRCSLHSEPRWRASAEPGPIARGPGSERVIDAAEEEKATIAQRTTLGLPDDTPARSPRCVQTYLPFWWRVPIGKLGDQGRGRSAGAPFDRSGFHGGQEGECEQESAGRGDTGGRR